MARKRMIDPCIWESEDFSKLSTLAKVVFIGMFSNADDFGRGRAKSAYLKSIIFPYEEDLRVADIDKTLNEIASNMSVIFYSYNENEYYSLSNWSKWQKVEKSQPSKIPEFCDTCKTLRVTVGEQSGNSRGTVGEQSGNSWGTIPPNRIEENIREEKRKEEYKHGAETAPSQPSITLILNDKSEYPVYDEDINKWTELYPKVDILQELRKMKGWLDSNTQKRKTKRGILNFITSWLAREQDKGTKVQYNTPTYSKPNKFTDYEQSDKHDFDEIEKKALEKRFKRSVNGG